MPVELNSIWDMVRLRRLSAVFAVLFLLAACATEKKPTADGWSQDGSTDAIEEDDDNDPLEIPNRFIFAFDQTLDVFIFRPAAATYRFLLPVQVRDSVRNIIRNLRSPVVVANDLFQGEMDRAETTAMRFLINTTVGVLGIFDVADGWGYPYHDEDFGQTLAVHGVGEGFYLVLPIFGPSSVRDGTGLLVDTFLDPLTFVGRIYGIENELLARPVAAGIDTRSRNIETLDDLQKDSIDFYARIRSLYRQTRANDIKNNAPGSTPTPGLYSSEVDYRFDADQGDNKPN